MCLGTWEGRGVRHDVAGERVHRGCRQSQYNDQDESERSIEWRFHLFESPMVIALYGYWLAWLLFLYP